VNWIISALVNFAEVVFIDGRTNTR
jgi:hypothetical protein